MTDVNNTPIAALITHTVKYTIGTVNLSEAFPDGHEVRPYLGFFLTGPGGSTEILKGVADTGSDYCAFPAHLLETIGFNWDNLPTAEVSGLGTDSNSRCAKVLLTIPEIGFQRLINALFSKVFDPDVHMLGKPPLRISGFVCPGNREPLVVLRWLRKFGQRDEWRVVPLTAINMAETRSNDDATSAPESYSSVQSEGGPSRTKRG
jgi:hypothetical protein